MPFRSGYEHSSLTILLLQHIIEVMDAKWGGRNYETFCKHEIFEPLGLTPTFGPTEASIKGRFQLTQTQSVQVTPDDGLWMSAADIVGFYLTNVS